MVAAALHLRQVLRELKGAMSSVFSIETSTYEVVKPRISQVLGPPRASHLPFQEVSSSDGRDPAGRSVFWVCCDLERL